MRQPHDAAPRRPEVERHRIAGRGGGQQRLRARRRTAAARFRQPAGAGRAGRVRAGSAAEGGVSNRPVQISDATSSTDRDRASTAASWPR